jgi:serine/threonine protein kinase
MNDIDLACLCDFGRSKIIGHKGYTTTFSGTARYMAPELMGVEPLTSDTYESGNQNESLVSAEEAFVPKLTKASDVYGFAMLSLEVSQRSIKMPMLPQNTGLWGKAISLSSNIMNLSDRYGQSSFLLSPHG